MKVSTFIRILLVLFLSFTSCNALANDAALFELLKALHANGTIDDRTYEAIRKVAEQGTSTDEQAQKKEVKKAVAKAMKAQPKINTKGKFEISSPGGDFKVRIGGRIQADAAIYSKDVLDHGDGTEIRRGRLFMAGTLWRSWNYKLQYDFTATGAAGIDDAYIAYSGWSPLHIKVGHFKEPFSLQNMTSSKYTNFMERGLPHLFVPGRSIGIGVNAGGRNWSAAGGFFGTGITDPAAKNKYNDDDEGQAVTMRVTYAPINDGTNLLHFGGSFSYRNTNQDKHLSFGDRPESHITDIKLVNTGTILADDFFRYGVEAAWVCDGFTLQGEYMGVSINRAVAGKPDLNFDGFYAEAMWFLTDDHRSYSGSSGSFKSVSPRSVFGEGGIGAWQIGARLSSVDLNDADILGGQEDNLSFGLNWFPNTNLRFSANYIKVLRVHKGPGAGDNPDAFTVRGQVEF